MPSPLRFSLPAVTVLVAGLLAGCGSAETPSGSSAPTQDAGASISEPARRAAGSASTVGVARGDRLNVRKSASPGAPVLARLAPVSHQVVVTGKEKTVGDELWREVRVKSVRGWVNARYLGYLGKASSHADLIGSLDIGATRVEVARKAANALGLARPRVVVKAAHPVVILDVLGEEDDAVRGSRLRVKVGYGEAGFQVRELHTRPICARGLSAEGLCL